jgi:hypothetical protein
MSIAVLSGAVGPVAVRLILLPARSAEGQSALGPGTKRLVGTRESAGDYFPSPSAQTWHPDSYWRDAWPTSSIIA